MESLKDWRRDYRRRSRWTALSRFSQCFITTWTRPAAYRRIMQTRWVRGVAPVALALVSVGCATIFRQGERRSDERGFFQRIDVASVPSGATVTFDGQERGVTPLGIHVDRRRKDASVRLQMDGYKPIDVPLTRSVGGAVIADVALGLFALNPLYGLEESGPSPGAKIAIGVGLPVAALFTDFVSGAVYKHDSKVSVRLVPVVR